MLGKFTLRNPPFERCWRIDTALPYYPGMRKLRFLAQNVHAIHHQYDLSWRVFLKIGIANLALKE